MGTHLPLPHLLVAPGLTSLLCPPEGPAPRDRAQSTALLFSRGNGLVRNTLYYAECAVAFFDEYVAVEGYTLRYTLFVSLFPAALYYATVTNMVALPGAFL